MKLKLLKLTLSLLTVFFAFSSVFPQLNSSINFTKKEIAFFKWGTGEKEVNLKKNEKEYISHSVDQGRKITTYYWPKVFHIDGNDNIYFINGNGQILKVSADGSLTNTISMKTTGGFWTVDEDGNIYSHYYKKDEPYGFILTKPDGTQNDYKNFDPKFEENGIVYDLKNDKALTITDHGSKPEKLPPHLISRPGKFDFRRIGNNSFFIYTEKINKHLQKINRRIDADKIQIKIEEKKNLWLLADLIGIDDDGNSYFFCSYLAGKLDEPFNEAYVMVYSRVGQKISEIPIELDAFNKQTSQNEIALDIQGNIFQMWASKDGIHILKWTKN